LPDGFEHLAPHNLITFKSHKEPLDGWTLNELVETSQLLRLLFNRYQQEGENMPDLLEEVTRQAIDELLRTLPPEELLKRVSVEDRLKGVTPDELLSALPSEMREALRQRLKDNSSDTN